MSRYETDSLFAEMNSRRGADDEEAVCGHIIRVAFESGVDREFDYAVPDELWPVEAGQRVEVPFGRGNKPAVGFCVEADVAFEKSFSARGKRRVLKKVTKVVDKEPLLDSGLMALARWISVYYMCPPGQVLTAMVPAAVKKGAGVSTRRHLYLAIDSEQVEGTVKQLRGGKQKRIVECLKRLRAFDSESAAELQAVLAAVGCTDVPVKHLADKQIVKITTRAVLKSLPAIPDGMMLEAECVVLNDDQRKALAHIERQIETGTFGVTLLYGVTDSGKTELYIRAIDAVLKRGKNAIVLLPEIALTAQTVQRFSARFERIAVMHSGLTAAQRNVQWQKIKAGQADVVIGARSAVFAPLANLGLIVVDEEHEPSYKQDTAPRYHGRDVAIKRAQLCGGHCVLGSATPSLETLLNCRSRKHFSIARLPKRVMNLAFAEMKLVDLKDYYSRGDGVTLISEPLGKRLGEVLGRGEQAILLLNRRGYSNFVFCPSCKHILSCRNCDVTLTFHKRARRSSGGMETITGKSIDSGYAMCHYCGARTLVRQKCPLCGKGMAMIGMGSQRLEEELRSKFPHVRVARVDSDSMQGADYYRVLRDFGEGRIDVLAGTQMLAKGLHFPNVTLVGVISADTCLYLPDFRANERTFQLISQVAGRAGRSEKKGTVYVQTFLCNQPAIQYALKGDFDGFVKEELKHRAACNLPPYWRLAAVVMRDRDYEKLEAAAKVMRERIDGIIASSGLELKVRGPMPATISRIQRYHRMQIIVQAPDAAAMQSLFGALRKAGPIRGGVKVAIDIDPVNLL